MPSQPWQLYQDERRTRHETNTTKTNGHLSSFSQSERHINIPRETLTHTRTTHTRTHACTQAHARALARAHTHTHTHTQKEKEKRRVVAIFSSQGKASYQHERITLISSKPSQEVMEHVHL